MVRILRTGSAAAYGQLSALQLPLRLLQLPGAYVQVLQIRAVQKSAEISDGVFSQVYARKGGQPGDEVQAAQPRLPQIQHTQLGQKGQGLGIGNAAAVDIQVTQPVHPLQKAEVQTGAGIYPQLLQSAETGDALPGP